MRESLDAPAGDLDRSLYLAVALISAGALAMGIRPLQDLTLIKRPTPYMNCHFPVFGQQSVQRRLGPQPT